AIVLIASAAWYFAGPPWHLDRHHRSIDWHEQVHLGGLQAIHSGYAPYIGPASNQYGPGFQFITYSLMTRLFQFDIVGFRESFAAIQFVTLAAWSMVAYAWMGLAGAVAALLLAVAYSPLAFFSTTADGTLAGFYGWANASRYFAALVVVVA